MYLCCTNNKFNYKFSKQWEHAFTKRSQMTEVVRVIATHQTILQHTFWQVLTHTICIVNLWTNMVAFRPHSGIANISILRAHKFSDYKFSDYESKDYHYYLRYCWRTGSFRFSPCGSINLRHANPLEWFLALCPLALCKGDWQVWGRWTIIFRLWIFRLIP